MQISEELKRSIMERSDVARLFFITKSEDQILQQWLDLHKRTCKYWSQTEDNPSHPKYCIATSPLTYSFKPSAVLDTCIVTCLCGEHKDITDYESA